jgi:hypothetical protein
MARSFALSLCVEYCAAQWEKELERCKGRDYESEGDRTIRNGTRYES